MWNDQPESIANSKTVLSFETKLDKVLEDQKMKYNFNIKYRKPGSRTTKIRLTGKVKKKMRT